MASIPPSESLKQPVQDLVQPPTVENVSTQIIVFKGKKPNPVDWDPMLFYKDSEFFRLVHGLPNEGVAPHKVTDVADDQMTKVFGESTKNGYKLANVQGIPHEDILALSQVVDGYDKPVNGVLSHTFAKGIFADFKQSKKVNWVAYAATKLKGQVTQWKRDGKGKPEGPPCVRKQQWYVRSGAPVVSSKRVEPAAEQSRDSSLVQKLAEDRSGLQVPPIQSPVENREDPIVGKNMLLLIMKSEVSNMVIRLEEVKVQFATVQNSIERLKNYEVQYRSVERTLEVEIEKLRAEEQLLLSKQQDEDIAIEEVTTDIELEMNKGGETKGDGDVPDQVTVELLKYMVNSLRLHNDAAQSLEKDLKSTRGILSVAVAEMDRMMKGRPDTPDTFSRLSKLSGTLARERVKIETNLKAQEVELQIVSRVFSSTCPAVIMPCYIPTSTETVCFPVDVSTCPVCCNGYHCFNWIPASCGHTFHPACLFASISSSTGAPKCFACDEAFSHDWLETWGIERGKEYQVSEAPSLPGRSTFTVDMKFVYGENCGKLAQRRQWVKTLDKDYHLKAKRCASTVMLSSTIDTFEGGEDGSSRPKCKDLKVRQVDGDMKKRKGTADGESSKPSKTRKSLARHTPAF